MKRRERLTFERTQNLRPLQRLRFAKRVRRSGLRLNQLRLRVGAALFRFSFPLSASSVRARASVEGSARSVALVDLVGDRDPASHLGVLQGSHRARAALQLDATYVLLGTTLCVWRVGLGAERPQSAWHLRGGSGHTLSPPWVCADSGDTSSAGRTAKSYKRHHLRAVPGVRAGSHTLTPAMLRGPLRRGWERSSFDFSLKR